MISLTGDGKVTVWRNASEVWRPDCISHVCELPASGLKVVVCGCISYLGVGSLAFVEGNMSSEKVIETWEQHLEPSVHEWFDSDPRILQGDNASVYNSVQSRKIPNTSCRLHGMYCLFLVHQKTFWFSSTSYSHGAQSEVSPDTYRSSHWLEGKLDWRLFIYIGQISQKPHWEKKSRGEGGVIL